MADKKELIWLTESNLLITAKFKATLTEEKIMSLAMSRIEADSRSPEDPLVARLWPGELKRLIGKDPSNIYKTLKFAAHAMNSGHSIIIEDGKGNFKSFALVTNADYVDGVFTVTFNSELRNHLIDINGGFTRFELAILTQFASRPAFRLYKLLKSHLYRSNPNVDNGMVCAEYDLAELRFIIGLANAQLPYISNTLNRMNTPDWDELYSKLHKDDRVHDEWKYFRRYVLIPAQKELEEKSNLRFEFEGIKHGRKNGGVRFFIYPNTPSDPDVIEERVHIIEEMGIDFRQGEIPYDILPEIYDDFLGHNRLTKEDIDLLLKKAGYDGQKLRAAIAMADTRGSIDNYMGWLIRCLEGDWVDVPVVEGSAEKAEEIDALLEEVHSIDKEKMARTFWEKIQTKEEFPEFKAYLENTTGFDIDFVVEMWNYVELVDSYRGWLREVKGI